MFNSQRSVKLFTFADVHNMHPLSLSKEEVNAIRDMLLEYNSNRDFSISDKLENSFELRMGPIRKDNTRNLYRLDQSNPIDNYQILDRMDNMTLVEKEYKPIKINPERARFSPGALYDLEEQERELE